MRHLLFDAIPPYDAIMSHYSSEGEAEVRKDATDRSFRTLWQGLGIDVGVAVILVLATAFTSIEWTPEYWIALAATLGRSVLQAIVAYFYRLFVAPKKA